MASQTPHKSNSIRAVEEPVDGRTEAAQNALDAGESSETTEDLRPGIERLREIIETNYARLERRRRGFLGVAGSSFALLSLAVLVQTPLYEATSLLLVKFGRELVYQSEVGSEKTFTPRDKETVINSELAILRSRPVIDRVILNVGIGTIYPDLGESVAEIEAEGSDEAADDETLKEATAARLLLFAEGAVRLDAALSAYALPDADVLSISFQHEDPVIAEKTVEALVSSFLESHLDAYGEPEIANFLDQRVATYGRRLDESEQHLLEFETSHAAFALESPQTTLMQWRDETRRELAEIETQMAAIRMRHMEDAAVSEARNALMNLQVEANQLKGELRRDARSRINVVERFIAARRAEADQEITILNEKQEVLRARHDDIERELKEFPALSAEYRHLRRERDADEDQYATYQKRLRDARLFAEMDREKIASINVIQPASAGPQPVWPPSKAAGVFIALVLSLVAGVLAVHLLERAGPTGIAWLDEDLSATG